LHAIGVGQVRQVVCAAPEYLKKHGTPMSPGDLRRHATIAASAVTPGADWKFSRLGDAASVRLQPRLQINTNDGAIGAALCGFGLTRVLSYQIASHLETGELQTVLGDYEGAPLPVHVIFREGRRASSKVRAFVDLMVARLRADKALN
jgi:DNA-binding transcriptional LysR family regulator